MKYNWIGGMHVGRAVVAGKRPGPNQTGPYCTPWQQHVRPGCLTVCLKLGMEISRGAATQACYLLLWTCPTNFANMYGRWPPQPVVSVDTGSESCYGGDGNITVVGRIRRISVSGRRITRVAGRIITRVAGRISIGINIVGRISIRINVVGRISAISSVERIRV